MFFLPNAETRDAKQVAAVSSIEASAHRIPTDAPEADGTLAWRSTTIVIARTQADDCFGIGYSYTQAAAAQLIRDELAPVVQGRDAMAPSAAWEDMVKVVRNYGRSGIAASAIAAVDVALWDLRHSSSTCHW